MTKTIEYAGQNTSDPSPPDTCDRNPRRNPDPATPVFAGQMLGYARVSTAGQDLDRQRDALAEAGCHRIFEDVASGTLAAGERPGMAALMGHARPGDRIVLAELSRAGRRAADLLVWVEELDERGLSLVVLGLGIDTATPTGRLVVTLLAAVSQMERDLLAERTRDGLAAARRRGRVGGRPRALTDEQVALARHLVANGHSLAETTRLLGGVCSERTVRRAIAES